jgi:hypothetical protein
MKTKKNLQFLFMALLSLSLMLSLGANAQNLDKYGDLERPDNIGDGDFDNFKNSSFDVYYNVGKLDVNLQKVETNLVAYQKDTKNIDFNSLKSDIKSLNEINQAMPALQSEITSLKGKSEAMVKGAKDFSPKLKAPKAVKNTDKSVKALDAANDRLKILTEHQKTALETAKQLLGNN